MSRAGRWVLGIVVGVVVLLTLVTAVSLVLWSWDSGGDDHQVGEVTTISTTR